MHIVRKMVTKEQIERFFRYQCSPSEADAVVRHFEQHPNELAQYMPEEEWVGYEFSNELDSQSAGKLLHNIKSRTIGNAVEKKRPVIYYLAAAAAVIAVAFFGWQYLFKNHAPETEAPAFEARRIANTTQKPMNIVLPDSSLVTLSPNSTVYYKEPFQDGKRIVELKGEAYFEVVKHAQMPFIVESYPLSTTVLGTVFSVKSFEKERQIKVALFKGVVAVGNTDPGRPAVRTPFYLSPGDVLTYDKQNGQVRFITSKTTGTSPTGSEKGAGRQPLPDNIMEDNNWYMFNNQPLAGVLDQLSLLYNEKISYTATDLEGLSFIGRIDKTDTLETVLQLIGRLNNLEVIREPHGFLMKKPRNQ